MCVCECERERECAMCVREREGVCMCVCEREGVCMCVCECEGEGKERKIGLKQNSSFFHLFLSLSQDKNHTLTDWRIGLENPPD